MGICLGWIFICNYLPHLFQNKFQLFHLHNLTALLGQIQNTFQNFCAWKLVELTWNLAVIETRVTLFPDQLFKHFTLWNLRMFITVCKSPCVSLVNIVKRECAKFKTWIEIHNTFHRGSLTSHNICYFAF